MEVAAEGWFWYGEGFPCLNRRCLPEGYHMTVRNIELANVKRIETMPRKLAGDFISGISVYGFVDTTKTSAPFFIRAEKVGALEELLRNTVSVQMI